MSLTRHDLSVEIAKRIGIPADRLNEDERERLSRLPKDMKAQVVGQDAAVERVAEGVTASALGYRHPDHPQGYVFAGPTGVGKTEVARALARLQMYGPENLTRFDMSEYMEKHSIARLIGAPPGYVGFDQGGLLTDAVRRRPYQVILFDEVEKAHADIFNILLQIFDHGELTDGQGRTVDFRNVIIIMTTNLGAKEARKEAIGYGRERSPEDRSNYLEALKAFFPPEMIERIGQDNIVAFNDLTDWKDLEPILQLQLKALHEQLAAKKMSVALTAGALEKIRATATARSEYGARPVVNAVWQDLNRALARADLAGRIREGDKVIVDWDPATASSPPTRRPKDFDRKRR